MRIVRSIENYEAGADLLLSIGVFDGVHIGHRTVLSRLLSLRKPGAIVGALTFEHHPQEFLQPGRAPKVITTLDEKINLGDSRLWYIDDVVSPQIDFLGLIAQYLLGIGLHRAVVIVGCLADNQYLLLVGRRQEPAGFDYALR